MGAMVAYKLASFKSKNYTLVTGKESFIHIIERTMNVLLLECFILKEYDIIIGTKCN